MKSKYVCQNCGNSVTAKDVAGYRARGFGLRHIACNLCGQHTLILRKDVEFNAYTDASQFYGGGWFPQVLAATATGECVHFELDLAESAEYNWQEFIGLYPAAVNKHGFLTAYEEACSSTAEAARSTR